MCHLIFNFSVISIQGACNLVPIAVKRRRAFPVTRLILLRQVRGLPRVFIDVVLTDFNDFVCNDFGFVNVRELRGVIGTVRLRDLCHVFVMYNNRCS